MNWIEIVGLVFGTVLGGQWLINILTIKSQRKKAAAEAETPEIDNAEKLVAMWQKFSETKATADGKQIKELRDKMTEFETVVGSLRKEISKLTKAINEAKKCPGSANCPALLELNKND